MANIYNIATGQSSSGDLTQAMADQGWVYGSAPAQGSNNAPIVNTQTGQTAAGFTNTAQAITGQMWQPVTSQNVDFNKASNPTFLKDSSVTPESYTATGGMTRLTTLPPSQYPMDVPSKIGSDVEEVKKDLTTELKKVTQAGQRISSPSELSQYKESDLARTTDGGIYRRDLALEKSVMPEYAKQYGAPKTKEEWNKFHDFAYKVANTTGANGLPINGTISDADGSKIPTDEAGVPDASASLTWTQQLNQVMSDITASREALAEKEDELAQYQEDTALGVQDVGEQLGRSAALVTGEQGALQQRRATKELTLAKQAQTLQLKIQGLTQDRQFISQQVQQMSSNARSNLSMILNSMTGSTTKWSDIPLAQQTALRQLAEQAGVPSDILSMSIDNQAEIASTQQGGQLSISEQLALREAGLTVDDNGNVIQIQEGGNLFTPGEIGGQCGDYTHKIADNIPAMGDTWEEKMSIANISTAEYKVGDMLIQKTRMPYGHVSIVTGVNGNQVTVTESNYGGDEKVGTRTLTMGDKSITGVYRGGKIKAQSSVVQTSKFSQTGIDWAESIRDNKAKLTDITSDVEKNNPGLKSEVIAILKTLPPSDAQIKDAENFIADLEELRNSGKGLKSAVGPTGISRGTFGIWGAMSGERDAFLGKADTIISKKALDALIEAKSQGATFGALSDTEMNILKSAATTLGAWSEATSKGKLRYFDVDEKTFVAELDKLIADYQGLLDKAGTIQSLDTYLQSNPDKIEEYNTILSENPNLTEEEILQVINQ